MLNVRFDWSEIFSCPKSMTYWVETDIEDLWLGVAKVCIPPRPSDVEDPSLGVTDGGIIWRGLSSQGSLVDVDREVNIIIEDERVLVILVVGHPGPFGKEEADLLELKLKKTCADMYNELTTMTYLHSQIPHASKSENMKARASFMVFNSPTLI